ncbi:hypothetical protein VFPPC_12280 [Pochonia chlamydosporia 170]|uniref:Uncharacterized protein n=1 Tax=Pochonia chlamydosporia 170 TaxID=1380566 RepID=A0A179F1V4_METCM|nr:hypothetical protein VFPPC_12280 [Pochonia chlamydosporia 170]OAQ59069.2 hypothetical protein VFPPC_12280 [Pochonia chlamydosporia 170]
MRHRQNPRFEDLDFCSEELLQYRENLIQKMHDPTAFILDIFGSDDDIWVERCLKIIRPKDLVNYGHTGSAGLAAATSDDGYYPAFYLDYFSIVGRPGRPITRHSERFFDNVKISFHKWQAQYSSKHDPELPFDLSNRTFRLASGASRELWFIVMHPSRGAATAGRKKKKTLQGGSALAKHHAEALASHIKQVFLASPLLGEGVEPSWVLNGKRSQTITFNKWTIFQELFMERWEQFAARHSYDLFWTENQPAFHAYDYGANIEIEVTKQIQALEPETHIRPRDIPVEDESDDHTLESGEPAGGEGLSTQQEQFSSITGSYTSTNQWVTPRRRLAQERRPPKYVLDNVDTVSYALAINLDSIAGDGATQGAGQPACLLADRNQLGREYASSKDYSFFPLGFHPAYGNFSSPEPPALPSRNQLAITRDNMSYENEGADVVSFGFFQAYSNIKRQVRHRSGDVLASQGLATAALTIPACDVARSGRVRAKQKKLLDRIGGRLTPDDPESSTPFARERLRVEAAITEQEFAFRFEQVVSIRVQRLVRAERSFRTVIRPIFQLMRFFLQEKQYYSPVLRRFPSEVFPGILVAFSTVFELAIEEMEQRFRDQGSKGLGLALSEGVAAIDRLGNFCFTGDPRVLPCRVFRPLETMESLRRGGWPYINPDVLDMRYGDGKIHIDQWPKLKQNRPVLMHVASLAYHYGRDVASNRHSQLWFAELGGRSIQGIATAGRFLEEVLRELWMPETKTFMVHQLHRRLAQESQDGISQSAAEAGATLREWEDSDDSFRQK